MAALFLSLVQTVARRSPDNRDAAFTLANGANGIAPIPLTAGAGLGGSVFAVDRSEVTGRPRRETDVSLFLRWFPSVF